MSRDMSPVMRLVIVYKKQPGAPVKSKKLHDLSRFLAFEEHYHQPAANCCKTRIKGVFLLQLRAMLLTQNKTIWFSKPGLPSSENLLTSRRKTLQPGTLPKFNSKTP